jgi:hypothetical protein
MSRPRMSQPTKDLTGQRYGRLVVIGFAGFVQARTRERRDAFWECQCDCGNIIKARVGNITRGGVKSCGCYRDELRAGLGQRIALPKGRSSSNALFGRYQYNAKRRGYDFALSYDEALHLFSSPCFYCGTTPSQIIDKFQGNGPFVYNGIDRRDNAQGYILENCVPCCKRCNWRNMTMMSRSSRHG